MLFYNFYRRRRGFSLIELLIVIIIISLVYFLGFSGIDNSKAKAKALTPVNLKSSIIKSENFTGKGTLLCINNAQSCYFREDISAPYEAYEQALDLKDIEAYTLDSRDALVKIDFGRYQDEKISFLFHIYPNGSSTQIILKQKEDIYFLPAFFGEPKKVDSLADAKELWLKYNQKVASSGDFY